MQRGFWARTQNTIRSASSSSLSTISIRIPDKATTTLEELRLAKFRRLQPEEAALIAGDEEILECDKMYFALDRKTLRYRWAHLCHLRYLLIKYFREPGPGASEATRARRRRGAKIITALEWAQLDRSYRQLAPRLAAWRRGADKDPGDAIDIFSEISELKEKHYRVLRAPVRLPRGERGVRF